MTLVDAPLLSKQQRQRRIAELVRREPVASQEELAERLAGEGLKVTQATLSRDLAELGAVKVRRDGVLCYAIAGETEAPNLTEARLRRVLAEWVDRIEPAGPMVVVRTPPGSAHMVASALDHAGWSEIAGTVAGDDTLMIVVRDGHTPTDLARRLAETASGARRQG